MFGSVLHCYSTYVHLCIHLCYEMPLRIGIHEKVLAEDEKWNSAQTPEQLWAFFKQVQNGNPISEKAEGFAYTAILCIELCDVKARCGCNELEVGDKAYSGFILVRSIYSRTHLPTCFHSRNIFSWCLFQSNSKWLILHLVIGLSAMILAEAGCARVWFCFLVHSPESNTADWQQQRRGTGWENFNLFVQHAYGRVPTSCFGNDKWQDVDSY